MSGMRCPVLTYRIVLPGTAPAPKGMLLRFSYAMSGTDIGLALVSYASSGADIRYAPTPAGPASGA
eukprot:2320647-Rhodomonas_salina.3